MTAKTAEALYNDVVRRLPLKERLCLAALILNEIVPALSSDKLDERDAWSEEDLRDLTLASLHYVAQNEES